MKQFTLTIVKKLKELIDNPIFIIIYVLCHIFPIIEMIKWFVESSVQAQVAS